MKEIVSDAGRKVTITCIPMDVYLTLKPWSDSLQSRVVERLVLDYCDEP